MADAEGGDDPSLVDICDALLDEEAAQLPPPLGGPEAKRRLVEELGHRWAVLLAGGLGGVPARYEVFAGPTATEDVVVARAALTPEQVVAVHAAARHPHASKRVRHFLVPPRSSRLERPLRAFAPEVFERLLALAEWADEILGWQSLPLAAFPEGEYIVYEAPPDAAVGPHLDEDSAVTAVAMLSEAGDFVGGLSCFAGAAPSAGTLVARMSCPVDNEQRAARQVSLGLGDVVLFRGARLEHWVSPVTTGRRVILQLELCTR